MKQKLKTIYLFTILCLAGLLQFSCQNDENFQQLNQNTNENLKFTKRNLNELFKEKQFVAAFQKIPKKRKLVAGNLGKTVMEEQYGFTIIGNIANEIITDSITSYTIKIIKDDTNYLENLVIQTSNYNPNNVKAFIFEYLNTYTEHYNGEIKVSPIVYNANQVSNSFARVKYECITVYIPCINHAPGHQPCAGPTPKTTCFFIEDNTDGGGGADSGETGSGDTGGTTSGANDNTGTTTDPIPPPPAENHNPVYTVPIEETEQPDPCNSLKKKFANPLQADIKNRTNALNTPTILNKTHESGFGVTIDPNDIINPVKYPILHPDGRNSVNIQGVGAYFSVHAHNNDYEDPITDELVHTVKIPSPGDFIGLIKDHTRNAIILGLPLSEVGVIIVTSQGTYALMLENFDTASFNASFGPNANPINLTKFEQDYDKEINEKKEDGPLSSTFLEKMLLNNMKKSNITGKVGLFKATNIDHSAWAKLEFDYRTNQPIEKPCN